MRVAAAGAAVVGVAFGMARFAFGLTLPDVRSEKQQDRPETADGGHPRGETSDGDQHPEDDLAYTNDDRHRRDAQRCRTSTIATANSRPDLRSQRPRTRRTKGADPHDDQGKPVANDGSADPFEPQSSARGTRRVKMWPSSASSPQ